MRFFFCVKTFALIFLLIILSVPAAAQNEELVRANELDAEGVKLIELQTFQGYQQALIKFREARALYAQIGEKNGEGKALVGIGFVRHELSQRDSALEAYAKALKLFESTQNNYWIARTLNNTGRVYDDSGEVTKALETLKRSLPFRKKANDLHGEAVTLNSIGAVYVKVGEYRKGLEYYQTTLAIRNGFDITNDIQNKKGVAITLNNIGRAFDEMGNDQKALRYLNRALAKRREANDKRGEGITLNNIGLVESDLGKLDQAIKNYEESLAIFKTLGVESYEAQILNNLAVVLIAQNKPVQALEKLTPALELYKESADFGGQSTTLNNIVTAKGLKGEKVSPDLLNEALLLARRSSERSLEARTLNNLMVYWIENSNSRVAAFYGKQSVNIYQEIRSAIHQFDDSVRRKYLASVKDTYRTLADVLIGLGQYSQAKQVLNMLKAEEYFEFVQRSNNEIKELGSKVNLTKDEKRLIEKYTAIADKVSRLSKEFYELDSKRKLNLRFGIPLEANKQKRFTELGAMLSEANAAFRLFIEKQLLNELGQKRVADIEYDRSLQSKLRKWGNGTVTIYTVVTEDRYRVVLTTPFSQVSGKTEISAKELNKKVFEFREVLQNIAVDPRPKAKELYDILLKPIEGALKDSDAKTLVWSLDGTLRYIPIAALSPDGKKYLVEDYQNAIITAQTRDDLEVGTNRWNALGIGISKSTTIVNPGNPEEVIEFDALPGSLNEVNSIVRDSAKRRDRGLLAGKELLDDEFTREAFEESLLAQTPRGERKYSVIHLASHFRLGSTWRDSFLVIGNGDYITLEQIANSPTLNFGDVELVTLSACDTAVTSSSNGSELDSLASAIQIKSGKAVMATLWPVVDQSTPLLMTAFYRQHGESGSTAKVAAMQKVQRDFISGKIKPDAAFIKRLATVFPKKSDTTPGKFVFDPNKPFAHPYFWSPFVLIGNWR